jgi:hypothetical protein
MLYLKANQSRPAVSIACQNAFISYSQCQCLVASHLNPLHHPKSKEIRDTIRSCRLELDLVLLVQARPSFQYLGGSGLPPLYTTSRSMYLSSSLYQGDLGGGGGSIASRLGGSSMTGTGGRTRFSHSSSLTLFSLAFLMSSESPTSRATSSYPRISHGRSQATNCVRRKMRNLHISNNS